jgi:hypothetical protein
MGERANFLPANSAIVYLLNYAVIVQTHGLMQVQLTVNL